MSTTGLQETIMGSKAGQMNLDGIRQRAIEIMQVLDSMIYTLRYAPSLLRWNDAVDKFAVLNVQLQQLRDQLRPVTDHYVIHPKSVNQSNASKLPIMLASRLFPEQEEYHESLLQAKLGVDDTEWEVALGQACALMLTKQGPLDPKGGDRRQLILSGRRAGKDGDRRIQEAGRSAGSQQESAQRLIDIACFGGLET